MHMETSLFACLKISEKCLPSRYSCEGNLICQHHIADVTNKNKVQIDVGGLHNVVKSASRHVSLIY